MSMMDIAEQLVKYGALLAIILGFVAIAFHVLLMIPFLLFPPPNLWVAAYIALDIVSIICGFIVQRNYYPQMKINPKDTAIYLIIFGIVAMLGAFGIGGLLILIGGILVLVEKEEL